MRAHRGLERVTPGVIAVLYLLIGGAWILFSDLLVYTLVDDSAVQAQFQTLKGWIFVALSTVVLYVLVAHSQRELANSKEQLDASIQQTSVLHRLLRHNLRNTCNVIRGTTEQLQEDLDDEASESLEIIHDETDKLVEISEKSSQLRQLVLEDAGDPVEMDLVSVVETSVEQARESCPALEINTDLPDSAVVRAHSRFELAVDELLENTTEHNECEQLRIDVSISEGPDSTVLEIADTGSGIPEMERAVLDADIERPTRHSQGLGLWITRTVVTESDGEFQIVENDPSGTVASVSVTSVS